MIRALKRRLIKNITKIYDPLIDIKIGNQIIKTPLSHQLREILQVYPEYNFNLPRIIQYIEKEKPNLTVIDVGANIGDTVAFIRNYSDVPILCIDGEDTYINILKINTAQYQNVEVCQALVGSETKQVNLHLKADKGTARITEGGSTVTMRTLENIVADFPKFQKSQVIKVDTDGFDTIILRSCRNYLNEVKPVLFFEFDPHLIKKNGDDAFDFVNFLIENGYCHFIFYTNIGDFMVASSVDNQAILNQVIHYFSGRKLDIFADVCAFSNDDVGLYEYITNKEILYYQNARGY